jgi:uncharacterized protein YgfB (UPF0149 family)
MISIGIETYVGLATTTLAGALAGALCGGAPVGAWALSTVATVRHAAATPVTHHDHNRAMLTSSDQFVSATLYFRLKAEATQGLLIAEC